MSNLLASGVKIAAVLSYNVTKMVLYARLQVCKQSDLVRVKSSGLGLGTTYKLLGWVNRLNICLKKYWFLNLK